MSQPRTLIVTGAGASAQLGLDDVAMPLMASWAERLRDEVGPALTVMSTLDKAQTGPDFEQTLGALFRFAETLDESGRFAGMARQTPGPDETWQNQFNQALHHARTNVKEFMDRLHHSLFANFGPNQINVENARTAYLDLFERLDLTMDSARLVVATTNYDRSLELAFAAAKLPLRTGFTPDGITTPRLHAPDLGAFREGHASVLYLHGAVGWYRREDGIVSMPADNGYQNIHGLPAVLYPGPDKDVGRLETRELWDELVAAIANADRVLILGHSLHDEHLVAALRNSKAPMAVTYYSQERPTATSVADAEEQGRWIALKLPGAIPGAASFGPASSFETGALNEWLATS